MKHLFVLPRISLLSFAMLPIPFDNDLWRAAVCVSIILPLLVLSMAAIINSRKTGTRFIANLFGYRQNGVDILIGCTGMFNSLFFGWEKLAIFWAIMTIFAILEIVISKPKLLITSHQLFILPYAITADNSCKKSYRR